jgi:hypothetical protein
MSNLALSETSLTRTRLGRNRLLAGIGAGLVGAAMRTWFPEEAQAIHTGPPPPCHGYGTCHACSGFTCTFSGCVPTYPDCSDPTCPYGGEVYPGQCWTSCYMGSYYRCCDWVTQFCAGDYCICRGFLHTC